MIDRRNPNYANTPASDRRPAFQYQLANTAAPTPPAVTILMPFYNYAHLTVDETATSIFRQSFQQWEWIIVNDCTSNPDALQTLERLRHADPRIRVIDNPKNLGLAGSRNVGFEAASTEYVFLIDDDDLIEPTALEKMYWFLLSYPEYAAVNGWSVGFGAKEYLWHMGFEQREKILHNNSATGRAMVRKNAHRQVGGYDAEIRGGMEDWEFWLRLANAGLWGATIPEFLDWYRRREDHHDRWKDMDGGDRLRHFKDRLRQRYARLYEGGFPQVQPTWPMPLDAIRTDIPDVNRLAKTNRRILMILPWLTTGGADKVSLDLIRGLTARGWEITLVTTLPSDNPWLPIFAQYTPDIFALPNFLKPVDQPAFLRYLMQSRRPDVVMLSNSEMGYMLLPYLRTFCPEPAYVDLCHSEQENWKNGGYPRYAVAYQDYLDSNFVVSEHLKQWMIERGAIADKIQVDYIGVDAEHWKPCPQSRSTARQSWGVSEQTCVIMLVARLADEKQPLVFAKVVGELARRGLDFIAVVAGDGPERPALEQYLHEHQLEERVRMLGEVPADTLNALMPAADLFFLPSKFEGIALTLFEAMASGVVVVAADVGGQRELVTPQCGVLIPRGDEDAEVRRYADALARLIGEPTLRAQMSREARSCICHQFTLDTTIAHTEQLLEQAIRSHRERPSPAVSPIFAQECATQTVEYFRMQRWLDLLWREQQNRCQPDSASPPPLVDHELCPDLHSLAELAYIENSGTWKAIQKIKRLGPYRVLARLRFGKHWNHVDPQEPPHQRLARIKKSRFFRSIRFARGTTLYKWYARRKYGAAFIDLWQ